MDRNAVFSELFRDARNQIRQSGRLRFRTTGEGFAELEQRTLSAFYSYLPEADGHYAAMVGEIFPRLFACDVATGYRFFHDPEVIEKLWAIYNRAAAIVAARVAFPSRCFRREPPYKVACITAMFSDYLAPAKALVNFALNLDRTQFTPVMVITNQTGTMERRGDFQIKPFHQTVLGKRLIGAGIDILGFANQENVMMLAQYLINICAQWEVDMVVTNASPFNFPEACLARSGTVKSFFDMHRGFPLYVDGIDAILHFVKSTRQRQLGPWLARGGKVIDYCDGIEVTPLPDPLPVHDPQRVVLLTASNYLDQRLSPEFCAVVSRLLAACPTAVYRLVGGGERESLKARFAAEVRSRLQFVGAVTGAEAMRAEYLQADLYLNEFPVSGVRVCLEAMSAALPVVTMVSGELHVNCTAADHVGELAITEYDPEKYFQLARRLICDPDGRRQIGQALRRRVETDYDYRKNFTALSRQMLEIHRRKLDLGGGAVA